MDFAAMKPADLRGLIRKGELTGPTTGMCNGYAQGNLVVLPICGPCNLQAMRSQLGVNV